MVVHLSPEARLELCKLIADRVEETNRKLYPTLAEVGIKGPAFYAYLRDKSVPSEEVTPKLITLAIALDREEALKIIRGELEELNRLVEKVSKIASTTLSQADDILETITGIGIGRANGRSRKTRGEEK